MADERKDYGPAGCASGCAQTMSGTAALVALVVIGLRTLVRGRRGGGRRG